MVAWLTSATVVVLLFCVMEILLVFMMRMCQGSNYKEGLTPVLSLLTEGSRHHREIRRYIKAQVRQPPSPPNTIIKYLLLTFEKNLFGPPRRCFLRSQTWRSGRRWEPPLGTNWCAWWRTWRWLSSRRPQSFSLFCVKRAVRREGEYGLVRPWAETSMCWPSL